MKTIRHKKQATNNDGLIDFLLETIESYSPSAKADEKQRLVAATESLLEIKKVLENLNDDRGRRFLYAKVISVLEDLVVAGIIAPRRPNTSLCS